MSRKRPAAVVLTALPVEYTAVRETGEGNGGAAAPTTLIVYRLKA